MIFQLPGTQLITYWRFTKLETAVKSSIALIDKNLPISNSFEWRLARKLCRILKPFENVTKTISGELCSTASLVIPITNRLINVASKRIFTTNTKIN
jgi:hypothetical protein